MLLNLNFRYYSKRRNDEDNNPPEAKKRCGDRPNMGGYQMFLRESSSAVRKEVVEGAFADGKLLSKADIMRETTIKMAQKFSSLTEGEQLQYKVMAREENAERKLLKNRQATSVEAYVPYVAKRLLAQVT